MGTGDHLRDVQPGDSFLRSPATTNAWQRAARRDKASERVQSFPPLRFPMGSSAIRQIRNDSGSARDRFDVLGIDGVVFDPTTALDQFKTDPVLKGITPTTDHEGKFAVLLEPLPADAFGPAILAGVRCVQVNVTDADHQYADVADGEHNLASGSTGAAQILWKESGTGTKWAEVRFPLHQVVAAYGGLANVYSGPFGAWGKLTWNSGDDQENVEYDTWPQPTALVVKKAGEYRLDGAVGFYRSTAGDSQLAIRLRVNDSLEVGPIGQSHAHDSVNGIGFTVASTCERLAVDDEVSLYAYTNAVAGTYSGGFLMVHRIAG